MYHTWFFQKRFTKALINELRGLELLASFSQQKDELILSFADSEKEIHLKADFKENGILSIQNSFARARRNSADLFSKLIGQRVLGCEVFLHERSFRIDFDSDQSLIFKMHGSRSNVLHSQYDEVKEVFKNSLTKDIQLKPSELNRNQLMDEGLFKMLMGKKNLHLIAGQTANFASWIDLFIEGDIFLGLDGYKPVLSLAPIETSVLVTSDPLEASNKFAQLAYQVGTLAHEREALIRLLNKKIKQTQGYLNKTTQKKEEVLNARNPEEIGHLIMANLHHLKTGIDKVKMEDIYNNGHIEIKLNPKLSPQKNAENYYRKSKNKKKEIEVLDQNIKRKQDELTKWIDTQRAVEVIDDIKAMRKIGALFTTASVSEKQNLPYHLFEFEGWKILVGRNAKANDKLTQRHAKKNDLWLHARDVQGSHVVIKERSGLNFSKSVIEKAAGLAAWYSKRKTDSLCPVIYTPKKFVRKLKRTPAGQVVVDKEQVVMIEPTKDV